MSTPVKIVGPFATSADTAKALGVSPTRRKQLEKLVDGLLAGRGRRLTRAAPKLQGAVVVGKKRSDINGGGKGSPNGNSKGRRASK